MSKRLCVEHINGECRNLAKAVGANGIANMMGLECPHCLRIDGKDGNGNFICDPDKAVKIFTMFKDKLEGDE